MSGIQAKAVLKYAVMPEVFPRVRRLFTSSFGYIALLMAYIYNMVRLIPDGHPYLNPQNMGKFGIRHVIAAAANHLQFTRKNLDQILIFVLMLTGIVLMLLMIALTIFSLFSRYAFAGAAGQFGSMFITQQPLNDIAFMLLDQVFGIPLMFNSCVAQSVPCFDGDVAAPFPWPFHYALQQLFRFYSSGILVIGVLIFLYYFVVIVVETATSGHPFGQRFKNMWVPVRLVVAVGLLFPLNYGYNSAQYITFFAAKFGAGFATNAWNLYNNTIADSLGAQANPTGEGENMVGLPVFPDASTILQSMSIVHGCAFAYYVEDGTINKLEVPPPNPGAIQAYMDANKIKAYIIKNPQSWMTNQQPAIDFEGVDYDQALEFSQRGDIIIRFGKRYDSNKDNAITDADDIEPTCGDIRVIVNDPRLEGDLTGPAAGSYLGVVEVQRYFYQLIQEFWYDDARRSDIIQFAGRTYLLSRNNTRIPPGGSQPMGPCDIGCGLATLPTCDANSEVRVPTRPNEPDEVYAPACNGQPIGAVFKLGQIAALQGEMDPELRQIWIQYNQAGTELNYPAELQIYGFAGAGMWYPNLARVNGIFATSFINTPRLDQYPKIMAFVAKLKKGRTNDPNGKGLYNPNMGDDQKSQIAGAEPLGGMAIALGLHAVHEYWNKDGANAVNPEKTMTTGAIENGMNLVFGTQGLFSMLGDNMHIHPLAQLVSLGKGLVEASVRNVAASTLATAGGGLLAALEPSLGAFAKLAVKFISSTAFLGLTAGFILFYILPFLPFVYFYFTVATWIKTIFEAMVGVPLWALAHLRMDGEGLPGDAAANGYFLIFEIFLRPILAIVGLIAGMLIFTAQVRMLHALWLVVTENVGGSVDGQATIQITGDLNINRSVIDEFFYTIVYAIIVYMMAIASFKLIDKIPDNILRWAGQGVSSFSDINQDATEGLTRYAAVGGMQASQQITKGLSEAGSRMGGAIGKVVS